MVIRSLITQSKTIRHHQQQTHTNKNNYLNQRPIFMCQINKNNQKPSTFQFPYLETCRVRKQGRTKEKGGTAYEVGTYFVAQSVSKKIPVPHTQATRTLGASTVTPM